ncbi:MAG: helix-turn-helix domain-containing protein [Streptosporangiaceae bacterium]
MARPKKPGPTLRSQWLGQQLRELRESCGLTLDEAGTYLQRDPSMVSRFETANYPIRRGDVLALLDLYGVADETRRKGLIRLSEDIWQKGWWEQYAAGVDPKFVDHPWLEARAERICFYYTMIVPGLLQTRAYAETLIRNNPGPYAAEEHFQGLVDLRMERQRVLDGDDPTRLSAVLDGSVLRRPIGGPEVMRGQLAHLLYLMGCPTVELRVLPLRVGWHAGLDGAFQLIEMPEPYPEVAYVESLAGRVYVEEPDAERFAPAYDELWKAALDSDASAALISATMKELS